MSVLVTIKEFRQKLGPSAEYYLLALPFHMREPVVEYTVCGHPVGDFLRAVLSNDLVDAVGRADQDNQKHLVQWAAFLHNAMPAYPVKSWGSREIVAMWQQIGGLRGLETRLAPGPLDGKLRQSED